MLLFSCRETMERLMRKSNRQSSPERSNRPSSPERSKKPFNTALHNAPFRFSFIHPNANGNIYSHFFVSPFLINTKTILDTSSLCEVRKCLFDRRARLWAWSSLALSVITIISFQRRSVSIAWLCACHLHINCNF